MPTGIELIAEERRRQIEEEGWTAEYDEQHDTGELAQAGAEYAAFAAEIVSEITAPSPALPAMWPETWAGEWWKPSPEPIRNLVKAGALIAAEIDRLQRLPRCRVCGCWEFQACEGGCYWVEKDLCSACKRRGDV